MGQVHQLFIDFEETIIRSGKKHCTIFSLNSVHIWN